MRMENPLKQVKPWASARTLVRWSLLAQILLGRCGSRMHLAVSGRENFCQHEKDFHHCQQKDGEWQTAINSVDIPAPLSVTQLRCGPVWHRHGQHVSRDSWLDGGAELYLNSLLQTQSNKQQKQMCFKGERVMWIQPTTLSELVSLKSQYPNAKLVVGNTEVGKRKS